MVMERRSRQWIAISYRHIHPLKSNGAVTEITTSDDGSHKIRFINFHSHDCELLKGTQTREILNKQEMPQSRDECPPPPKGIGLAYDTFEES